MDPCRRSACLFIGVVWVVSLAGCAPYDWESSGQRYTAAEQGRVVQLRDISVCYTQGSAWSTYWHERLVEPVTDSSEADDHLPRWPEKKRLVDWHLLQDIDLRMPAYRSKRELLHAGQYLNREVGTFRQAWIVGTSPFAVAFLVAHPTTGATTFFAAAPGIEQLHTRTGELVVVDKRVRDARLVSEADLNTKANVVLLYPPELQLTDGDGFLWRGANGPLQAKILILREPLELQNIVRAITEPGQLDVMTEKTIPISVKAP